MSITRIVLGLFFAACFMQTVMSQTTVEQTTDEGSGTTTADTTTSDAVASAPGYVMIASFLFVSIARNLL